MKYDVALIGCGGAIAEAIIRNCSSRGLSIIGFGRKTPVTLSLLSRFIEFDLGNPAHNEKKIEARTVLFNATLKGRYLEGSLSYERQGIISAPNFSELLSRVNVHADRLMTMGSSEEYGPKDSDFEISEETPPRPTSSYGKWKLALFNNAQLWKNEFARPHLHVRPFNVFGPGTDSKMFVGSMISSFLRDETFEMTRGEQWRSFVSKGLMAQCICELIELKNWDKFNRSDIFNLSGPNYLQLKEVVRITQELLPNGQVNLGALAYRHDEVWHQKPNLDLIKKLMGQSFFENMRDQLNETIKFYEKNDVTKA